MLFPLGLGLKLKDFPFVTYLLVLLNFVLFFTYFETGFAQKEINTKHFSLELLTVKTQLFEEYCHKENSELQNCLKTYRDFNRNSPYYKHLKKIFPDIKKEEEVPSTSGISLKAIEDFTSLTNLLQSFEQKTMKNDEDLASLKSFEKFKRIKEETEKEIRGIYLDYDILSKSTISFYNLVKAMFSHFNFLHLLGNMYILFVFGRYVEARVGSVFYLLIYLLGGFVGLGGFLLLWPVHNSYLLGASANVFCVLGLFYASFYDKKMKVLVFYLIGKVTSFPIKYYFLLFYIILELIFMLSPLSFVAHGAHVLGFIVGIISGVLWNKYYKLPRNFLYLYEKTEWENVSKLPDQKDFFEKSRILLIRNPFNQLVKDEVFNRFLEVEGEKILEDKFYQEYMKETLPQILKEISRKEENEKLKKFLRIVPFAISLNQVCAPLSQKDILYWIDRWIDEGSYLEALRFIHFYLEKYPKSEKRQGLLKTFDSILKNVTFTIDEKESFKHLGIFLIDNIKESEDGDSEQS